MTVRNRKMYNMNFVKASCTTPDYGCRYRKADFTPFKINSEVFCSFTLTGGVAQCVRALLNAVTCMS